MKHDRATRARLALCAGALLICNLGAAPRTAPPAGLRESTPSTHALVNARIVPGAGQVIEKGTLVVRDGVIVAVGAGLAAPADARVWDCTGRTLYPGFFDAFAESSAEATKGSAAERGGSAHWNSNVAPQLRVDERYVSDPALNKKLRAAGITARLLAPAAGIIKGTSAVVTTGDEGGRQAILKDQAALHLKLTVARGAGRGEGYPTSPMGAYTLVRQAFYDAGWYGQAWDAFAQHRELPRPERNDALAALRGYLGGRQPVVIDAGDELYALRAHAIANEFGLRAIVRGSGEEYRRLAELRAAGRPIIVPLNFPKAPQVNSPEAALNVSLEKLMHWDLAPENPARLTGAGVKIAFTTHGLKDVAGFLPALRKAVRRGLTSDDALTALTLAPAEWFGLADRLGSLEVGKAANLVVATGDLFDAKTKIVETWVDGQRHEVEEPPQADLRGTWQLELGKADGTADLLTLELAGQPKKLVGKLRRGDKDTATTSAQLDDWQLSVSFKGQPLGYEGVVRLSCTIARPPDNEQATAGAADLSGLGAVTWADGARGACAARRTSSTVPTLPAAKPEQKKESGNEAEKSDAKPAEAVADASESKPAQAEPPVKALYEVNYPLGEFGRAAPPDQPRVVLFRGATVWTSGPQGVLENACVLVEEGRIKQVGSNIAPPDGAVVVEAAGQHITPGIIDCHSHVATDGGVNESGQSITAEVRVGDFVDPNDINIYRQLAGGVTSSNILHGSANTIGGQNQVLKFRWGSGPEAMKFAAAPPGIKFALGENVKQSNWPGASGTRYPQTRMGVEQLVRDAFQAARDYRREWDQWNRLKAGLPPRVDLELEALAEVVEGKRLIHCHSYRQDEILALLRTCEDFGVRIATFQHILEGYKVADVMARHGVGGSSFSDWWAFKFEVFDAIPYNGALLHNAGVVVSFNSDDAELARRLNLEAAKAVKYGGVPPAEALKFVTLNPARQLRIDQHVGSLEPGKDADLVVWSGSPLSTYSRCEQTWIDGRKYFDRGEDRAARRESAARHAALVQRVLASGDAVEGPDEGQKDAWPREDIFCHHGDDHGHAGGDQGATGAALK